MYLGSLCIAKAKDRTVHGHLIESLPMTRCLGNIYDPSRGLHQTPTSQLLTTKPPYSKCMNSTAVRPTSETRHAYSYSTQHFDPTSDMSFSFSNLELGSLR